MSLENGETRAFAMSPTNNARPDNKNIRVQIRRNTKEGGGAETATISSFVA
jgi:hypothetical protein